MLAAKNLAMLLVSTREDEESLERAKGLATELERSNAAPFLDTVAWVRLKTSERQAAVDILEAIVRQLPDDPTFNYHLGVALYETGDPDGAKRHLEKSLTGGLSGQDAQDPRGTLSKIGVQ